MDGDLLFWLAIIGFWLLRRLLGKSKKSQAPAESLTESATDSLEHIQPGDRRTAEPVSERKSDPTARPAPIKSDFDETLREIREALGMSSPRPEPEVQDRYPEEYFTDLEDSFERKPAYSEGDFHSQYPDKEFSARKTDFGYHSALERANKPTAKPEKSSFGYRSALESANKPTAEPEKSSFGYRSALKSKAEPPSKPVEPEINPYSPKSVSTRHTRASIRARLKGKKVLQETVLLNEILGPPLSRRTPSARRRLS